MSERERGISKVAAAIASIATLLYVLNIASKPPDDENKYPEPHSEEVQALYTKNYECRLTEPSDIQRVVFVIVIPDKKRVEAKLTEKEAQHNPKIVECPSPQSKWKLIKEERLNYWIAEKI